MGDHYREILSCLYSSTSCFLVFLPNFPPLISIFFLIWYFHLVLCLPLGHFPSIFVCSIFLNILSSLICITCPNHLNLLSRMQFFISSTPSSNLMLPLLIRSFFVLFKISLKKFHFHDLNFAINKYNLLIKSILIISHNMVNT